MFINRLFSSLLFVAVLMLVSCLARAESTAETVTPALNEGDFSVLLNDYAFTPGDAWNNQSFIRAGKALSSVVAGEVVINEQRYNYYQHTYEGFQLFSATAVGNASHAILAEILLDGASVPTARNIIVGDSVEQVQKAYGPGKEDNSDNQHWLIYKMGDKQLMFEIDQQKVSHIMLNTTMSAEQHEVSADQAIALATNAIHTYHLTALDDQCLRYDLDDTSENAFYIITVREDNHDVSCGGDPDISPRLFDIKVARDNTQILTNADNADGDYRSLVPPATNNQ
ncbi:hypothetical protein [Pantoea ananatis]|uniref:hypothetical protein n=1 Tax=Pantoea ananas TaxID=553 RepID=UPI000CF4D5FE|nr:hypothetical protein [Pantoea ananatis]PQK80081.1 hypothetical protein CG428_01610 [Pantoea ananatis]